MTTVQLNEMFVSKTERWENIFSHDQLRNYLRNFINKEDYEKLSFKYCSEDNFNNVTSSIRNHIELSVLHLNIRSLNANHRGLCQFLALLNLQFDVIVLSEIWSTNIDFYNNILPEYNFIYDLPRDSNVGGIGIFVHNSCSFCELTEYKLECSKVENIWLEVVKNGTKYVIGGVYRHPNQCIKDFHMYFDKLLSVLSLLKRRCIIAGDINIDFIKIVENKDTADYLNNLLINSFMPTILMPTRITANSATLIDHIYYCEGRNNKSITSKSGNFLTDITDHLPNYLLLINNKKINNTIRPMTRIFSKTNKNNFVGELCHIKWDHLFAQLDANSAYDIFNDTITALFNKHFPLRRKSRKSAKDKKWISKGLKKSSRVKTKLYKKWLSSGHKDDQMKYKNYKCVYEKVAKEAQNLYYHHLFNSKENSIKKLWNNLNMVCSFKKNKTKTLISKIVTDGKEFTDPVDICNEFNRYFCNVGEELVAKLPKHLGKQVNFMNFCNPSPPHSMACESIDREELLKLIDNLNNNKSPGPDNFGPTLVKEMAGLIIEPLLFIYNLSFSTGVVPDKLKVAKVIPIYKKGEMCFTSNYRPISLLSIFNKLLEKLMHKRLYSFLQKNSVLYQYQFGFRKNYSTSLALIEVIDSIIKYLDDSDTVVGIYLDLQKAFDTVNHEILLAKMKNYGIRGVIYNWFASYLRNRKQFTAIGKNSSEVNEIKCGVPQGSVLGPLLFLIYVNDIHNAIPEVNIKLFADDTNIFIHNRDSTRLSRKANLCLKQINEWFVANKLSLSLDKTCYTVFSKSNVNQLSIQLNGTDIKRVNSCRYLGVIIDCELKWKEHIEYIYKKTCQV